MKSCQVFHYQSLLVRCCCCFVLLMVRCCCFVLLLVRCCRGCILLLVRCCRGFVLLLVRCFRGFVLQLLEYCSALHCSDANTRVRLLDRVVSGASFIAGDVIECNLSNIRSVTVLCMLKIMSYPISMHPLSCAGYVWCLHRSSVYLCTSSLLNLTVPQDFDTSLNITIWNDLGDSVSY